MIIYISIIIFKGDLKFKILFYKNFKLYNYLFTGSNKEENSNIKADK